MSYQRQLADLNKKIKRLRTALQPFVTQADIIDANEENIEDHEMFRLRGSISFIDVGHIRAAREAYKNSEGIP